MRTDHLSKWTINAPEFKSWLGTRASEFEPALDPSPTLKALVFLALLDNKGPSTYEELGRIFESRRVVQGTIPIPSLRVALSELGNVLNRTGHRLTVRAFKDGQREVKFQLTQRNPNISKPNQIIFINQQPTEKSPEIAQHLMENQSLPFYALYYLPRSACWWVTFSSKEAEDRKQYEADAWDQLGISDLFATAPSSVVGVVGLATGEGLGEIELIRNILTENYTVHYLAIDLSPVLLAAHIETIREVFDQELKEGLLFVAGVLVDVFSELDKALLRARSKFVSTGVFSREDDFIPANCPVVASFLGNCLGNDAPDREAIIFQSVAKAFPSNRPLAILVGVSVMRTVNGQPEPDVYTRSVDDFLLQTPHHLLSNIRILRSKCQLKTESEISRLPYPEFLLPEDSDGSDELESASSRKRRSPSVVAKPYTASHGIEGHIYRFYYRLDFDLEMPRKRLRLPAGTDIALYTIIKYNVASLVEGIKRRRFKVNYRDDYHLSLGSNNVKREYAVFVAYLDDESW
jgi:hypothetical protein